LGRLCRRTKFEFCTFWSATIHRRFGIFRLGANYSLSNVSCGDAEKVLRTGEQSGDKSPQSKKNAKLELSQQTAWLAGSGQNDAKHWSGLLFFSPSGDL
jgi:hypothetical protein